MCSSSHDLRLLLLVSLAALVPLSAQSERNRVSPLSAVSAATAAADAPATLRAGYRIGFGDVLQIVVFKEPDASVAETTVRSDGKISVPFIGDVHVAGLTPLELKDSLTEKFSPYLKDPDVSVLIKNVQSEKVVVIGAVKKGGTIRMLSSMTVLEALGEAGLGDFAKVNSIYVLRSDANGQVKIPFRYKDVIQGKHPDQNIVLRPGDTVVVP